MFDVVCNKYSICNNSSSSYCHRCKENISVKSYFHKIDINKNIIYRNEDDINNVLNNMSIGTKIEVLVNDLHLTGILIYKKEEYIAMEVNNIDKYKFQKNNINQLKILT